MRLCFEGHDPPHECIEQRHGKGHVSMRRTVDHAFLDQLGANRPEAGQLHSKSIGDVTCTLRSWTQFGHRPEEILFAWREAVVPYSKEVLIQTGAYCCRSLVHDFERDGTRRSCVPRLVSPFLQKIRISLRQPKDLRYGLIFEDYAGRLRWLLQRLCGVLLRQRADHRKTEEAFCV